MQYWFIILEEGSLERRKIILLTYFGVSYLHLLENVSAILSGTMRVE